MERDTEEDCFAREDGRRARKGRLFGGSLLTIETGSDFSAYGTIALFVVFGKNERSNMSPAEACATAKVLKAFETELGR